MSWNDLKNLKPEEFDKWLQEQREWIVRVKTECPNDQPFWYMYPNDLDTLLTPILDLLERQVKEKRG